MRRAPLRGPLHSCSTKTYARPHARRRPIRKSRLTDGQPGDLKIRRAGQGTPIQSRSFLENRQSRLPRELGKNLRETRIWDGDPTPGCAVSRRHRAPPARSRRTSPRPGGSLKNAGTVAAPRLCHRTPGCPARQSTRHDNPITHPIGVVGRANPNGRSTRRRAASSPDRTICVTREDAVGGLGLRVRGRRA